MRPVSIAFTDLRVTPASAARSACVRSRIARCTFSVFRSVSSFIDLPRVAIEEEEERDEGNHAERSRRGGHRHHRAKRWKPCEQKRERELSDEKDQEGGAHRSV